MKRNDFLNKIRNNTSLETKARVWSYAENKIGKKMKSIFSEIRIDHMDDNGVIHIDGYKTSDDNEEVTGIGYFINGEVYWRDPEFQFDPHVKEVVAELKAEQHKCSKEKEENIKKAVISVVYDNDAKPRKIFTDVSPIEKKLRLIDEAVKKIKDICNIS